jgi:hypothetical protein
MAANLRQHQAPPWVVLVTVGAGDELVGAGVGGVAGGVRVGVARGVVGATDGCGVGCADGDPVGGAAADPVGCAAADVAELAVAAPGRVACGKPPCRPVLTRLCGPAAVVAGAGDTVAGLGGVTVSLPAVCSGAVRANTIAKPTVASAPIWVVRQVSRPSRRNPASRACVGESS